MNKLEFTTFALASKPSAICLFETIERVTLTNKIFKIDCIDLDDTWKYWTSDKNFLNQIHLKSKGFKGNEFKLILRPLSEATDIIKSAFNNKFELKIKFDSDIIDLFSLEHTNTSENIEDILIENLPFDSVLWLIKNHFDICGLIEKGEAVDYHTLSDFVF